MSELSADEAVYRDMVAGAVGLDVNVVTAWIACESGWDVTKADHNYLNIGPGRSYADVASAATAAIANLTYEDFAGYYAGIHTSVGSGGWAQVQAIIDSPWDAGHYENGCFANVYASLSSTPAPPGTGYGGGAGGGSGGGGPTTPPVVNAGIGLHTITDPLLQGIGSFLGLDDLGVTVLTVGLTLVFVVAAFGIVILGVSRMTGTKPVEKVTQAAGTVATVAALA